MGKDSGKIPVNNGNFIKVKQDNDGILIIKENGWGGFEDIDRISGKDFISLLNWYKYQKENGNHELTF